MSLDNLDAMSLGQARGRPPFRGRERSRSRSRSRHRSRERETSRTREHTRERSYNRPPTRRGRRAHNTTRAAQSAEQQPNAADGGGWGNDDMSTRATGSFVSVQQPYPTMNRGGHPAMRAYQDMQRFFF